jgi:pimeloyl-ACP methyl ester carboxylesterase
VYTSPAEKKMADTSSYLRPPPLDPRTASTQSLVPSFAEVGQGKKRLLVVYIHGFVGSEASFHSFPFHVHTKLKEKLAATHAIHSKVYPRYKTYKAFHLATDNLSRWLSVHEDPNTDVILVGHSMGGLLAEEVVLLVCRAGHLLLSSDY